MNNKTLLIILGIAVVALIATLIFSGGKLSMGEGDDPAMMMAQQRSQSSRASAAAVPTDTAPAEEAAEPEAVADAPVTGDEAAAAVEAEIVEAEPAAEEAEAAPAVEESPDSAAEEAPAEAEAPAETEEVEAVAEEEAAPAEEAGDEDLLAEEALPEDPIERFKQMDPREIIKAKYDDLVERQTRTWDEEDPDFIPQTGRVDPLTRVNSAVPDDLKPPRSGETDENQIQIYLGTQAATEAVTFVSFTLFCHNVIQIGLEKRATFSFPPVLGDRTFTIAEGSGFGLNYGGVNVTIRVTAIGTDSVDVLISGAVPGADGDVTKSQKYIPRAFYH